MAIDLPYLLPKKQPKSGKVIVVTRQGYGLSHTKAVGQLHLNHTHGLFNNQNIIVGVKNMGNKSAVQRKRLNDLIEWNFCPNF